jgi:hypothetical protein
MSFKQEMPQFMGDSEPGTALPFGGISENGASASRNIGQQHAFKAIKDAKFDIQNAQASGDVDHRNSGADPTELFVDLTRQNARCVDISKVEAIRGQSFMKPPRVWSARGGSYLLQHCGRVQ